MFGIIFLMFLVGMSAIGITHQTAWLVTTPKGMFEWDASHKGVQRMKCANNIKNLGAALADYQNKNEGRYPDDLATLIIKSGMSPGILICAASDDWPAQGNDPSTLAESINFPGHCSFLYFGKGLTSLAPNDTIILAEPLKNHGDGINVMYADFHVEWIPKEKAEPLLEKLKASMPATQPTTRPAEIPVPSPQ
jgi:prepilin-type processing-associated H-X9-DG protein